jgi:hypothetical protein
VIRIDDPEALMHELATEPASLKGSVDAKPRQVRVRKARMGFAQLRDARRRRTSVATLVPLIALVVLVGPADALAPGPWRLMAHGAKSGRAASVFVQGRWTYQDEYGPSSGIIERFPIPQRMAFVVTTSPSQHVHVVWGVFCYGNREWPEASQGETQGLGNVTIYPTLYGKRIECDPYVVASLAEPGTVRVRIYAY